ncbi:argininosuccinate lyase [Alphaproteobacteria bacterium]|nr:argininosuccinate lyase [Alphaproteobacteria bacterium]
MKKKINKRKKNLWAGRFNDLPSEHMTILNASIDFDKKLYEADIEASIYHAEMLANQNIIKKKEFEKIKKGLSQVNKEIKNNKIIFKNELEDIHTHIEARLIELIGTTGKKLHTARSRNDQVATATKIWARKECKEIDILLRKLQQALLSKASKHVNDIMPGFTHLQPAQPISLAHHLLAYVNMFGRDRENYSSLGRHNFSPLGSAALAGTTFNINRKETASKLGFKGVMRNSLDAVSDRDFVLDILNLCSLIFIHLSRLSEEIILWSSPGFNFITLSEKYSTGSSIMPQKKNPDAAELIRGKSGRIIGNYVSIFNIMKALPLAYSKDMQEDKEPLFDGVETTKVCLHTMIGMIESIKFIPKNMKLMCSKGFLNATDMADWFVKELKMTFRDAHKLTGKIVKYAELKNLPLEKLSLKELKKYNSKISNKIYDVLDIENSVKNKISEGGTNPLSVNREIILAKEKWLK